MYSKSQLIAVGVNSRNATEYAKQFDEIDNPEWSDNPVQRVLFLAQTLYESAYYSRIKENINYSRKRACQVWPHHKEAIMKIELEGQYESIMNIVYGNRKDLGNDQAGDGCRFIGRGLIQLTGRANYTAFKDDVVPNMTINQVIASFDFSPVHWAIRSAYWFWSKYVVNRVQEVLCNDTTLEGCCNAATYAINRHTDSYFKRAQLAEKVKNILT